ERETRAGARALGHAPREGLVGSETLKHECPTPDLLALLEAFGIELDGEELTIHVGWILIAFEDGDARAGRTREPASSDGPIFGARVAVARVPDRHGCAKLRLERVELGA